jgi:hypothetical protein
MINFKKLFETVYEPRSGDEKNFKDKHVIAKHKYPADTESQFTSDKPKAKRKADYDEGDDAAVYEAANVHTKRADKEPVIVQSTDPKTGQSKAKTVMRRAGEIKIEEVDLEEGTVGHGKYTITTGTKMSGMGEGGPSHVVAKRAKMSKLGVPHHDEPGEYGHTVRVTVKNNETGETTHHHVYQRDTDRGSKEALVSTRAVGTPRAKQKEHEKVLHNYLSGKKVSSLKEESVVVDELGEKVVNPYAVGMAAAMKATGDRPPLKKSTIIKGHEIAKSIKKEAMDPVGKEDDDIDNDGDVDKSDKYLKNRRKAIGRALQKEDASIDQENSSYTIYKKSNKPNPIKKNAEDAVKEEVEQIDELSKKTLGSYIKKSSEKVATKSNHAGEIEGRGDSNITPAARSTLAKLNRKTVNGLVGISRATNRLTKEEAELDEAVEVRHDRYLRSHGKKARDSGHGSGQWMFTHKSMGDVDYNNDKEVHTARGKFADAKKSAQKWAKEHGHHSVYVMESAYKPDEKAKDEKDNLVQIMKAQAAVQAKRALAKKMNKEEVDQLDELSPDTLHAYVKKAAPDIAGRTMSAVASNQSAETKKHASKLGNRIRGVTSASGRLADKANADRYEEFSHIEEAFKVGAMKLHDGSSVTLTRESVDSLNSLFTQLNGANKAKMEERMMSGKKGFQEILSFAENI